MKYSEKLLERSFSDNVSKSAYLKACRWLAENIIPNEDMKNVSYTIEKQNTKLPSFKLTVYALVEEEEIHNRHCQICKEVHQLKYLNSACRECNSCNVDAYVRRLKELMNKKLIYLSEKLDNF